MKTYTVLFGLFTVATTSLLAQNAMSDSAATRPSTSDISSNPAPATTPTLPSAAQSHAEASKPFTIVATVREEYDDNIYTTHSDKVDQFKTIAEPSFLYSNVSGPTLISARYTFDATYYPDRNKSFDLSHEFVGRVNESFSDRFNLDARDRVSYAQEPEISSGAVVNRVAGDYFNNTLTLQLTSDWAPKFNTVTTYSNDYFHYEDAVQSQLNDRDVNTISNDFDYLLTPTLTLVAGGTYTNVGYSHEITPFGTTAPTSRDWQSVTLYGGVNYNFTPQLQAGVRLGGVVTQYDVDSSKNPLSPYASVFTNWQLGARSSLDFTYTHTITQTDVNSYSSAESDNFALTAHYQFTPKLSGQVQANYNLATNNSDASINPGLNDFQENTFGISLGLGYQLNPYLGLNLGYIYSDVDSDDITRSYDRNEISLGMTATY